MLNRMTGRGGRMTALDGQLRSPLTRVTHRGYRCSSLRTQRLVEASTSHATIKSFFSALNARDFTNASTFLEENVSYITGGTSQISGRKQVLTWFQGVLSQIPEGTSFVMEDLASEASAVEKTSVSAKWHLEILGLELPWSKISSVYTFSSSGKVIMIKDDSAVPADLVLPYLSLAVPMIDFARPFIQDLEELYKEQGPPESLSTPLRAQSLPEGTAAETRKPTTSIPSVNMTSNALQQTERTVISSANVEVRQTQSINSYAYTSKNQPDQPNISARSASSSSRMNSSIINMSGIWRKDLDASDSAGYEAMLDALGLNGLQRTTARLIEGMEIKHSPGEAFEVSFLTVVPFFKVTESLKFGSSNSVRIMRRDMKPGQQTAFAEELAEGSVRVSFDWGEPAAGTLQEQYTLNADDQLTVQSNITVGGRVASSRQVYFRQTGDREDFLKQSKQRNSSLETVLERQKKQYGEK